MKDKEKGMNGRVRRENLYMLSTDDEFRVGKNKTGT